MADFRITRSNFVDQYYVEYTFDKSMQHTYWRKVTRDNGQAVQYSLEDAKKKIDMGREDQANQKQTWYDWKLLPEVVEY